MATRRRCVNCGSYTGPFVSILNYDGPGTGWFWAHRTCPPKEVKQP